MERKRRKSLSWKKRRASRKERVRALSPDLILELMGEIDRPVLLKDIVRQLGLRKEQRRETRELLSELVSDGRLVRIRRNRYSLPSKLKLVTGRVKCHPDGYAFVIAEKEGEKDVFISPGNLMEAMHGDRVLARVESVRKKGREGKIVRVLERGIRKVVGRFTKKRDYAYVIPEDNRILHEVYIPERATKRARANQIVVAEITQHPIRGGRLEGRIAHILGYPGDPEVEVQIILHKYDLPYQFPAAALEEASNLPLALFPEDVEGRVDLRRIPTFTIDGENARDFDDAVAVEEGEEGEFTLYVSISDVSHYVKEGSALDQEAYLRGTSVYFPDRAISMFPHELSNEICCLHPRMDRLALTVELKYDRSGQLQGFRFYPSVIRSHERLTYTIVKKILVDGDGELRSRFSPLVPSLERMALLCQELRRRRLERGAIDFDLPEPEVILNLQGETEDIIRAERNLAHQLIEEFMIAANEAVAGFMQERKVPCLYRIHEPPSREATEEFKRFIGHLGYRMAKEANLSPADFQRVLEEVKGKPEERVVNNVLLRSMKWAKYASQNLGHFGLASNAYTHFTSPIRRYPDLIVHRLLKRALSGERGEESEASLHEKAEHLSNRERVAMEAEREIVDRYRIRFMKEKIGEVFEGIISGVMAFGFFVELKEVFVEGLVPVTKLSDDDYEYHEKRYCLVGQRTRRVFRIGDPVTVRVEHVDLEKRHLDLGLVMKKDRGVHL